MDPEETLHEHDDVEATGEPTERARVVRAVVLGAVLGAVLALLGRRPPV